MISAPVFRGFRKVMPPMSRTEKEAIDAGTTRWEGDLFQASLTGKTAQLSTTATHCRRASVSRRPGRRSVPDGERFQITHELADLPPELWAYLKEHRFCDDH